MLTGVSAGAFISELSFASVQDTNGNSSLLNVEPIGGFINGDTLRYMSGCTITAQNAAPNAVQAIDVNGKGGAQFIVSGFNITVGSIMNGASLLNLAVSTANTLTFTGTASGIAGIANAPNNYSGVANVSLNNPDATLEVAAPITATFTVNGNNAGNGILKVNSANGAVAFSGAIGNTNSLKSITVTGGNNVNFQGTVTLNGAGLLKVGAGAGGVTVSSITAGNATGGVQFTGAGKLILGGNITTGGISANGNNATISLTANSTVGGAVNFTGQTLTISPTAGQTLTLTTGITGANLVDVTSAGTIAGPVTTSSIQSGAGNVSFTGLVTGTAGADLTITANGTGTLGLAGITGAAGGANDVIFASGSAGSGAVTVGGNITTAADLNISGQNHATTINGTTNVTGDINVTKTDNLTTFNGQILGGTLHINRNNANNATGAGVRLNGGTADNIIFDQAGLLTLGGNVAGTVGAANGGTISLTANSTVDGAVTGQDIIFVLDNKTLTLNNGGTLTGDVRVKTTITGAPGTQGNINVTGGTLDLSGANTTIEITNSTGYTPGAVYTIIGGTAPGSVNFGTNTPTVTDASPLVVWVQSPNGVVTGNAPGTPAAAGGGGTSLPITPVTPSVPLLVAAPVFNLATAQQIANEVAAEALTVGTDVNAEDVMSLLNLDNNTGALAAGMYQLTAQLSDEVLITALLNITSGGAITYTPFTSSAPEVVKLQGIVANRVGNVSLVKIAQAGGAYGLSAGDDLQDQRYGAWAMGVGSKGTQKSFGNTNGYKDKMLGAIVGADTKLNDNAIVGFAAMSTESNISHKGVKAGDKTKIPTWALSLYGLYDVGNWFINGDVIYSDSRVHNKSKRVLGGNARSILWGVADSKYHSKSTTLDLSSGYNHIFGKIYSITPSVGLSYSTGRDDAYKETGADTFNYSFNKKTYNSTSGIVGVNLASNHAFNNLNITPELRAQWRKRVSGKDPVVISRLDGQASSFVSKSRTQRTSFSIGVGINVKSNNIDFGVGYDAQMSKKYLGHSGSLKVRVNF